MNERTYNHSSDRLRSPERVNRLEVPKVVALCLENKDITSILDIGTGTALFAEEFYKRGVNVSGVDINEEYLKVAKEYVPTGNFVVAPAEKVPFKNEEFDATFYGLVFHEVDDYEIALKEAARVSQKYVFILEWEYKTQEFGPPLKDRISEEAMKALSNKANFKNFEVIHLQNLVLYQLTK
jgi:ubiquinone/menaquinone biosynthesis C-methylase UbiE